MMTLMAFILTLAILVVVHELGHFQVARWCGVKVLKFSFGFGKPLYRKNLGKEPTEFLISALPLGGYVKMLDERELNKDELEALDAAILSRAFNRQAVWKRILIVLAGPAANILLAVVLYWALMMQGVTGIKPELGDIPAESAAARASFKQGEVIARIADRSVSTWQDVQWVMLEKSIKRQSVTIQTINAKNELTIHHLDLSGLNKEDFEADFLSKLGLIPNQPKLPAVIGRVVEYSPAQKAGLRPGDKVVSVDGLSISDWQALVARIQQHPSQKLRLDVLRDKQKLGVEVTPDAIKDHGTLKGQIGAALQVDEQTFAGMLVTSHYSVADAFVKAANKTWETSLFSLKMLANMLTGDVSVKTISGPVTIANYAGQSAHLGLKAFIGFLAIISISLGVLNLLPIPVLDGGHLLYYIVEILKGSPVSERVMEIGQRIGMFIILLLMTCALYNDINRLIAG
jgi:regulator of sigma E protease